MSIQSIAMPTSQAVAAAANSGTASPLAARAMVADEAPGIAAKSLTGARAIPNSPASVTEQKQQVEEAVKAVKEFIQPMAGNLEFQVDEETDKLVIKIVDSSSGELIRQIPSEEMLEIAKALDRLQGILVRQKA